ncbi:23S rRNA pseudouridine955/2504/2580 synthase [Rhodoblastus acidophilus]|uniref:23S rRNA pseudouridine955/2504/2580 synthase n=1 Tax=Rhodoblastus acidophilus TaxID=1074 RepID=A0A212RTY6_RHOAC|nr:RluA family pseudouridine synthase [Rhodoblastus acidophilus]PPQ37385.1 pseudouridine synthase [Rhodoblastus acidophilus]RAI23171.1 pseudouridine synthase [Rhodoblastus acidophilus]SNB76008.1 23S rRNA pseudouridine955/2504/2580 synthase [Rhodoblastus acidophilus]
MKTSRPKQAAPARKPKPTDKPGSTSQPAPAKKPAPEKEPVKIATGVQNLAVTEDEDNMRLDRWFKRRFPTLALSHLAKICRKGEVRLDGKRVETASRVATGQSVRVPPLSVEAPKAPAVKKPAQSEADQRAIKDMILFEDRDLMALNKPFGLAVQGGSGTKIHLDGMLASLANERGDRPVLVHRLDRDTSGVLLIAKTRKMAADLGEVFRSRSAKKIYWALVEGVPKPSQGRISLYLAKGEAMGDQRGPVKGRHGIEERRDIEKMRVVKHGDEDAQHSVTYYAIVDKLAPRCSWLSMKPMTGRTHQLRAHAEAIGCPIVGDPKYGHGDEDRRRRSDPNRNIPDGVDIKLHLLARRLLLPHPRGGMVDVTAPLPPHMKRSWELFGFDAGQYDPILDAPED